MSIPDYQAAKTDWSPDDAVTTDDFNRIEGNMKNARAITAPSGTTSGTSSAYTISLLDYDEYKDFSNIIVKIHTGCAAAATININSLGPVDIVKYGGIPVEANDLKANQMYILVYNEVDETFQILYDLELTDGTSFITNNSTASDTDILVSNGDGTATFITDSKVSETDFEQITDPSAFFGGIERNTARSNELALDQNPQSVHFNYNVTDTKVGVFNEDYDFTISAPCRHFRTALFSIRYGGDSTGFSKWVRGWIDLSSSGGNTYSVFGPDASNDMKSWDDMDSGFAILGTDDIGAGCITGVSADKLIVHPSLDRESGSTSGTFTLNLAGTDSGTTYNIDVDIEITLLV